MACGRPFGQVFLCAMALALGASVGYGQWLETRITLPDSLGGAIEPTCLTTDTSERFVYIGDRSAAIYVVDAEARTRVARIPSGYVYAICTSTRQNKVYAADCEGDRVLVISCANNQVVATVPTGAKPFALCYNGVDDKVYSANYDSHDLTVIDCSSDSVIKTIRIGEGQANLCYNPTSNRVFCASSNTLLVIDGASDSRVAAYTGRWYGPSVVNAVANRVYLRGSGGVLVLNGATGVVLDSLSAAADVMCLNSRTQKLYAVGNDPVVLSVFDCTADSLIDRYRFSGATYVWSIACDTAADKVYASCEDLAHRDKLFVIDGVTDTIAAKLWGPNRGVLLVSSKRGRAYSTDRCGSELAVFDTGTDSLLRTVMIGGTCVPALCYDSADDRVYYANYSVLGEVGAIDAATNQPVGQVQVGRYPEHVIWHSPTNRVYCSGSNVMIIDPMADTVTGVLDVGGSMMCSAPILNKVYVFIGFGLAVIDCRNDSIVKTIPIPTLDAWSMCFVAFDKLYVGGYGAVSIVDCIGDTLIRSYPFSSSRLVPGREGKRVYCWRPYSLSTFDPAGDTLVAEVPWDAAGGVDLLYVQSLNKVYCADRSRGYILVADGTTDTVTAEIPLYEVSSLGYDSANGLVYCGHGLDSVIRFVDCRTDSVVGSLSTGPFATTFVIVPAHNRVYVGGGSYDNSYIPVIRTDPPGVEEAAPPRTKNVLGPTIASSNSLLMVHQPALLLDAMGRKVLDIEPGQNDLTGCRAGVYFIRARTDEKVVKILLVD